jgi:DNA-binding transcriptional regulator PaaX
MPSEKEVAGFIRTTFRSVWAVELLCYLRTHRDRPQSLAEIVAGLRASDLVVRQGTQSLLAAGLIVVEADDRTLYCPASDELDALATAAEALYARSPDAVRRMIIAAANPSITAFADAFRLRKD